MTLVVNEALCPHCGRPGSECRCGGRRPAHNVEALVDRDSMELMTAPPMFPGSDDEPGHVSRGIVLNAEPGDGSELMIPPAIDWGRATKRRTEPERERVTVNRHGLSEAEALMIPPEF